MNTVIRGVLLRLLDACAYRSVWAGIALPNDASVRLHEELGFRPRGMLASVGFKSGAWHDVGLWRLELAPAVTNPPEPVAFAEAQRTSQIETILEEA